MDRITRVRIRNARALRHVDLELGRPLTVLIGENGSGKSTILECLEVLRKAAEPGFMERFYAQHRGLHGLLRKGAAALELGVVVEDDAGGLPRLEYGFALEPRGAGAVVSREHLRVGPTGGDDDPLVALRRTRDRYEVFHARSGRLVVEPPGALGPEQLATTGFGNSPPNEAVGRLLAALRGIEVHLPFDTLASWAARAYQFSHGMRASTLLMPAGRLDLLGFNLANAWAELKNRTSSEWDILLDTVRLGLGEHVDNVLVKADAGGGHVALYLAVRGLAEPIPAADLSDGQLAWLAFVAMARLDAGRSLLAVDEPELHLHPSLLGRVVSLLATLPGGAPVILGTHSDRVLEMLDDPADAVRVCTLAGHEATVSRLDPEALPRWLEEFGDAGRLRASGYLGRLLVPAGDAGQDGR